MATDVAEAAAQGLGRRSHSTSTFPKERYASITSSISDALARLASPEAIDAVLAGAAFAGATVLYNELMVKVPVKKGVLQKSLYRWHDDKRSKSGKTHIYLVGPNKREAGHWAHVEYGHWRYNRSMGKKGFMRSKKLRPQKSLSVAGVKHGGKGALAQPVWVPPHPYLRPTWESRKAEAVAAMQSRAMERLKQLLRPV